MELANIFLETDDGKVKLTYEHAQGARCRRSGRHMLEAAEHFLDVLDKYIFVQDSTFYMAIRDGDMLYFRCDRGKISPVHNEFFVFDRVFVLSAGNAGTVHGVTFVVTDQFPIVVRPRRRLSVHVYSNNTRFYER